MSLLGVHISFEDLYQLCYESVDDAVTFSEKFRAYIFSNSSLLKFVLPGPDVYAKALEHALPRSFIEGNPFARNLLDKVIPGLKTRKSTKRVNKPKIAKPIIEKAKGSLPESSPINSVKINVNEKALLTVRSNSSTPLKIRTLGVVTKGKLDCWIRSKIDTNFSSCKVLGCEVCPGIWRKAVISKCTHTNPCNDFGLGVHLSKTAIFKLHKNKDAEQVYNCKLWSNPLPSGGCQLIDKVKSEPGSTKRSSKRKTHDDEDMPLSQRMR